MDVFVEEVAVVIVVVVVVVTVVAVLLVVVPNAHPSSDKHACESNDLQSSQNDSTISHR